MNLTSQFPNDIIEETTVKIQHILLAIISGLAIIVIGLFVLLLYWCWKRKTGCLKTDSGENNDIQINIQTLGKHYNRILSPIRKLSILSDRKSSTASRKYSEVGCNPEISVAMVNNNLSSEVGSAYFCHSERNSRESDSKASFEDTIFEFNGIKSDERLKSWDNVLMQKANPVRPLSSRGDLLTVPSPRSRPFRSESCLLELPKLPPKTQPALPVKQAINKSKDDLQKIESEIMTNVHQDHHEDYDIPVPYHEYLDYDEPLRRS